MSTLNYLQTKELGLIELISMGLNIYLANWQPYVVVFCFIVLPFQIINVIDSALIRRSNPDGIAIIFLSCLFFLNFVVLVFASSVQRVANAIITENILLASKERKLQKIIPPLLGPYLILSIRYLINSWLRTLLLIIPGLIYSVNNYYYGLAFILRDQRGRAAFEYSQALVKDNWGRVFLFPFLIYLLAGVINAGVVLTFVAFLGAIQTNSLLISLLGNVFAAALSGLLVIGFDVSSTVLFLNLDFLKRSEFTPTDRAE
jgi:hypothetical protein